VALFEFGSGGFKAIAPTAFPAIGSMEGAHLQAPARLAREEPEGLGQAAPTDNHFLSVPPCTGRAKVQGRIGAINCADARHAADNLAAAMNSWKLALVEATRRCFGSWPNLRHFTRGPRDDP
jgi:hypothetical protein